MEGFGSLSSAFLQPIHSLSTSLSRGLALWSLWTWSRRGNLRPITNQGDPMAPKDASSPGVDEDDPYTQIGHLEAEKCELELKIEQLLQDRDFAAGDQVRQALLELEAT